ncbi:MAG: NAD(P)H-dependent oxidoreductase [Planctomycetaceae bacterium]|nr:NAD(P)H-dependent oxidoreductase [Planctomycetaceae bacterium]
MILVVSCSLNPDSRSRILAEAVRVKLVELGHPVETIDLRETSLPMCDGVTAYGDPNAKAVSALVKRADAVVLAAPVYNYGVSAATKNLIELTGRAWTGKIVGMLFAAGGQTSYMAGMGLANSLMLDFRCLVIPRYVYADGDAFDGDRITDSEIERRVTELAREVTRVSTALLAADQP